MIVTLLTDFGTADHFVAAMKGVILSHDRRIRIVDVTHQVPPFDIATAAFSLLAVYRSFPPGTVHTVVVDPGVGSSRRPLALSSGSQFFVGPDNGVFDYLIDREQIAEIRQIDHPHLSLDALSSTFHGRDVFAPAAAALATGFPFADVGAVVNDPVRVRSLNMRTRPTGEVEGSILYVDGFGNCITSLVPADLPGEPRDWSFRIGNVRIEETRPWYGGGSGTGPFMIVGSSGFLEVALNRGSAAESLGLRVGDPIVMESRLGRAAPNLASLNDG